MCMCMEIQQITDKNKPEFTLQWNSVCFRISPCSLLGASSLTALSTVRWSPPKVILCSLFDSGSDGTYSARQYYIKRLY